MPETNLHDGDVVVGDETKVVLQPLVFHELLHLLLCITLPVIGNVPELVAQILWTTNREQPLALSVLNAHTL